jgi:SAM-dependent methyltransferase
MPSLKSFKNALFALGQSAISKPRLTTRFLLRLPAMVKGFSYARQLTSLNRLQPGGVKSTPGDTNPLKSYFMSVKEGRGIWKWLHYFDAYEKHLNKFVGREVHVVEVGVYSGGSLQMWKHYFGPGCRIYGVDIEEACRGYQDDTTRIFIGDQEDRGFWRQFKANVPLVDIVIDDGGHVPEQQMVTLEEMLPHLRPGGVYICEDHHGDFNRFAAYVHGLTDNLNTFATASGSSADAPGHYCRPSPAQAVIHSVHLYPFVTVIEKTMAPVDRLYAPKHGTIWQPFL